MKMKTLLTLIAALALCSAPAFAAPGGPVQQAKQRIESKAAKAEMVCRDKRLGPKKRSKQICNRYGICNNNVPCGQAVQQWKERSLANLKNSPAAKPGHVPPPPPQGDMHRPQPGHNYAPPPPQPGHNYAPPPPPQGHNYAPPPPPQGHNHVPPPPPPGQPR